MIDELRIERVARPVPRRARRRPRRAGRRPRRPRPGDQRARRRGERRRQPADHRRRRPAGRRRRPRRAAPSRRRSRPRPDAGDGRRTSSSRRSSSLGAWSSPERRAHPGKFGFVSLHNLLASGYAGAVFGTNLNGEEVLGVPTVADVAELPDGAVDLVFVCTPPAANRRPARGVRRARGSRRPSSRPPGYGEAGPQGQRAEERAGRPRRRSRHPPRRTERPRGRQHAGRRCARRSSLRTRRLDGSPSPARAATSCPASSTSPGSPASASPAPSRPATPRRCRSPTTCRTTPTIRRPASSLAYLEGISDGRALFDQLADAARRKPLVLLKGGATAGGARAAASHTGALAADDKVFDGECRAAGDHPGGDGRGGVRGGGDVRHPAGAARPAGGRRDDGGRVGRRDRRRDHPRSATSNWSSCPHDLREADRRAAAAALEPQQSD